MRGPRLDDLRWVEARDGDLTRGHVAGFHEVVQHLVGAGARGRQVHVRRVLRRRFEEARDHRRFGERDLAHGLAEIELRGGLDADGTAAEIGAVEVHLQDLPLREARFEQEREEQFLQLALERPLGGQEQVLGELLGQRRAALHHLVRACVFDQRARRAEDVDAEVLEEAPVFSSERRFDQGVRDFLERHRIVVQETARADLDPVPVEELHRELALREAALVELVERWQCQHEHDRKAAHADGHALRQHLVEDAASARQAETRDEARKGIPAVFEGFPGGIEARVDPGVDAQPVDEPAPSPLLEEPIVHEPWAFLAWRPVRPQSPLAPDKYSIPDYCRAPTGRRPRGHADRAATRID